MITVLDIANKKFEKAIHGYKVEDVNEFLSLLEIDYQKLVQENSMLKEKIGILVEKVTEYKEIEHSLRSALSSAQKISDNIIEEARRQSEGIIADAREKSDRMLNSTSVQIISENHKLEQIKRETYIFKERIISLYKSQIGVINAMVENLPDEQNAAEKEKPAQDLQADNSDNSF